MVALTKLSALAHPGRLAVFRMLVREGPQGVAAGEIARRVGTPANTMSGHLATLARAGLITSRRDARTIYYAIDVEGVRSLFGYLVADCCNGQPELCAPLMNVADAAACCAPEPKKKMSRA